jgi:hypothetical protein
VLNDITSTESSVTAHSSLDCLLASHPFLSLDPHSTHRQNAAIFTPPINDPEISRLVVGNSADEGTSVQDSDLLYMASHGSNSRGQSCPDSERKTFRSSLYIRRGVCCSVDDGPHKQAVHSYGQGSCSYE